MKKIACIVVLIVCFASMQAWAKGWHPTIYHYLKNSLIVGIGEVLEVSESSNVDGKKYDCALIESFDILKGPGGESVKEVCYRNHYIQKKGPGPRVQEGDEVIFFAVYEMDGELALTYPDWSLVSPSNAKWTIKGSRNDFLEAPQKYAYFKEAVVAWFGFESAPYDEKGERAADFLASNNGELWLIVMGEISEKDLASKGETLSFDYKKIVPVLVSRGSSPVDGFRLQALSLLGNLNNFHEVNTRFINEEMDVALLMMESKNLIERTNSYYVAKGQTDLNPYYEPWESTPPPNPYDDALEEKNRHYDFGYNPDAPEAERTLALEKWKAWWKENRGKGRYDRSEEHYRKYEEWKIKYDEELKTHKKLYADSIAKRIERGEIKLDPSSSWYQSDIKHLNEAGYVVTPDGKVIKPSDVKKEQTQSGAGNPSLLKRIGCSVAAPGIEDGSFSGEVLLVIALLAIMLQMRRRR